MNDLWLTDEQAKQMVNHAQAEAPQEVCGLLAGVENRVVTIIPVRNVDSNPVRHYTMDPLDLSRHLPALDDNHLQLLGFYHSHPQDDPIPSSTDIREVSYPGAVYVIVGLKHEDARIAAWAIRRDEVTRVKLCIGEYQPALEEPPPGNTQIAAIILTSVIAFALFILIAIQLLPPAPPIP